MLNLLLVDDESSVRESIKALVHWDTFNINVIGSCSNAIEAMSVLIDERPDILLTDIKMPVMDGIELAEKALEMYPSIQCILLSGYNDFSLAQAAMRKGIRYYLLKPCSKAEIEQVLRQCCQQIEMENAGTIHRYDKRKQLVQQIVDKILFFQARNSGNIEKSHVEEIAQPYLDISLLQEAFTVIVTQYALKINPKDALTNISEAFHDEEHLFEHMAHVLSVLFQKTDEPSTVVNDVKEYIELNYANPNLTLQFIADQVIHMNAQYLGKCFLKQEGMRFSEYTMAVRMEKSMELLKKTTDNRIYEVAEQVGLGNNSKYFYQLFKKYTGMTPKEFQQL